jgi:EAL domain-containing protein (putative c-di-GMP-specific phosphodiesterase class I)
VDTRRIAIEVNESILGRNEAKHSSGLKNPASGVRTVMDSFGVGTLSLGLLSRYSFDKVKLDRSFLLTDVAKSGAVLAAICSLGRSLGFRVAGQGVETSEHASFCASPAALKRRDIISLRRCRWRMCSGWSPSRNVRSLPRLRKKKGRHAAPF